MVGRPRIYTPELGDKICDMLAAGRSLNSICKDDGIPDMSTVLKWLQDDDHDFTAKHARARRIQGERAVDKHLEITDDLLSGRIPPDIAKVAYSGLEWQAKKLVPKKYGDAMMLKGDKENPLFNADNADAVRKRIEELERIAASGVSDASGGGSESESEGES